MRRYREQVNGASTRRRSDKGIVSTVNLAILLIVITSGSLSVDLAHGAMVKDQLQTATEAGALAGAQELAKRSLSSSDLSRAQAYATNVTSSNKADNVAVSNLSPNTTVSVNLDSASRTVTVTATRQVNTIFSRVIGCGTIPVIASSTAGAFNSLKTIRADQVTALAVSLDHIPSKGPQAGVALNTIIGPGAQNQEFTIVLSPTNSENSAWVGNWGSTNPTNLTIGVDTLSLTNGTKASLVQSLTPGTPLILALFKGQPPFNSNRVIVGVTGAVVTSVDFPKEITIRLKEQVLISGTQGTVTNNQMTAQDTLFVQQWSPWQVLLIN